jgi:hypothetical protein
VKCVATRKGSLVGRCHGPETYGTLSSPVNPAPFLIIRNFGSTRCPILSLGATPPPFHYLMGTFIFSRFTTRQNRPSRSSLAGRYPDRTETKEARA